MNDPEQDDMANAPSTEDSPPTASEPNAAGHNHVSFEDVISGAFDSETAVDASAPEQGGSAKRVLAAESNSPKLHKVLAQAGMGSRLEMEALIVEGADLRQRRACARWPTHQVRRYDQGERASNSRAHRPTATTRVGLSQANRGGGDP